MKKIFLLLTAIVFVQIAQAQSKFTIEDNQLVLPSSIEFQSGSDKLKPESVKALSHIKAYLEEKSYISTLRIEVHSDNSGNEAANQKLTEKRALSVGKWLVAEGIDCTRLICVGFGSNKPVADNATPEGKAANSRVTIVNAGLRGRAIGGMPLDGSGMVAGDVCK